MPKPTIYVETSVWSHAFAEDAPDVSKATLEFLAAARKDTFELYVSDVVFEEFANSSDELANKLTHLVEEFPIISLECDVESNQLRARIPE